MLVIPRSVVARVARQFMRQGGRPFGSCKGTLGVELYGQRKGLRLPWFRKYRPLAILRQTRQRQGISYAQDRAPTGRG